MKKEKVAVADVSIKKVIEKGKSDTTTTSGTETKYSDAPNLQVSPTTTKQAKVKKSTKHDTEATFSAPSESSAKK